MEVEVEMAVAALAIIRTEIGKMGANNLEAGLDQQMDWTFVRRNFGLIKDFTHTVVEQSFWITFKELIKAFEDNKVADQILISYVLLIGSLIPRYWNSSTDKLKSALRNMNMPGYKPLDHIKILRQQPYLIQKEITSPYFDIVWRGCKDGHELLVTALLTFGVAYVPEYDSPKGWIECGLTARSLFRVNSTPKISGDYIKDIFKSSNFSKVRIYAIFRVLEILAQTLQAESLEDPDPAKYFRCFRKVFQTVPEILVTSLEARLVLEKVAKGWDSSMNLESKVEGLCKAFELHYPDSIKPKQPRSLEDICLIQVRDHLRIAGIFPYAVHQLDIPNNLKKSIILEE